MATNSPVSPPPLPPTLSSPSPPEVPLLSTAQTTPSHPLRLPTLRTDRPRPVSSAKQSRVHQKGLRRTKFTRPGPTKIAYLRVRSQVKWHFQEARWWKRLADRPASQMKPRLPLPPPPTAPVPLQLPQRTDIPRAAVPTPKRFKAIKRTRRLKSTRPKPSKMEHLRLRSGVKWHLKDLGFEKRPPPPPPPPLVVPTQPTQVHPVLMMIGPLPAWLWPAGVFHPPPGPVAPSPQQTGWDASTRLSMLTPQLKRAYRPRRRKRLIPDGSVPMEGVE